MSSAFPAPDLRALPHLGVEVHDESTLLRSRLTLASNWFSVDGLRIVRRHSEVRLFRDDHSSPAATAATCCSSPASG